MLFRQTNPFSHRLARLAFIAACVAALCVGISGPLYRFVGVELDVAISLFRYGFYVGAGAIALGLATIVPTRPGERRRGFLAALLAIAIGAGAAYAPFTWFLNARSVPRINDITSDTADPPKLVQTLQMRRGAVTPPLYNKDFAGLQHDSYPDIQPIELKVAPAEAFRLADKAAMAMGWDVVARAPDEGRLEAIDTTKWFGFHDDIVVRIRADGGGSRIDIRSKSRVGRSDLGVNARRIRDFIARLKAEGS
jgi:uncharacterized protein (DUF1499 family)